MFNRDKDGLVGVALALIHSPQYVCLFVWPCRDVREVPALLPIVWVSKYWTVVAVVSTW